MTTMTTATDLIIADRLTKQFRGASAPAVAEVTARVVGGQVTGLIGPDGSGKTTLLRLFSGLLRPTSGSVQVCGLDTERDLDALRDVVSYMPQRFGLYEDLTVAENLDLYADLRGVAGRERDESLRRLLAFTALEPFTSRLAGRLSGGMKQKLGLACALIKTPRVLLLDEPSVGVDPISRRELWRLVEALVDQGIAVVWSTSYLDEAERCRWVIGLDRGRVLHNGDPADLTARAEGCSYLLRGAQDKRQALTAALRRPDVVDGVIQGDSVRLVMAPGASALAPAALGEAQAELVRTPPRFEDAFVMQLVSESPPRHTESPLGGPRLPRLPGVDAEAPVVEAVGLTKRFGDFTAARQIGFQISRGEVFGLLGPNGAGKSTIFRMLCGLIVPTAGMARVAGLDLNHAKGAARARLGYMAQKFSLYSDLSTRQNLDFFSGVYGLTGARRRQAVERMIDAFDLESYASTNAGMLPLGFKQRLALACAVMHEPSVLFLDEPTSGVDPLTRREFWSHINAMVDRGVTVLVTTHFLDEAESCDRIALVYRGQVIVSGPPDQLKHAARGNDGSAEPTLEEAFITLVERFDREDHS